MKTETKKKKEQKLLRKKRIKKLFAAFVIIFITVYLAAGYLLFSYAFERENFMSKISKDALTSAVNANQNKNEKPSWITENSRDMYIWSFDDLKLHALFAENKSSPDLYAVICHGYTSRASHMSRYAKSFYVLGYNVLVPDARAHGESEGNVVGMSYPERKDILLWINEILKINKNAKIVLYGVSMGAATVLMTAGEKALSKNVICVISDCAFTNALDEVKVRIENRTGLPFSLLAESTSVVCKFAAGYSLRQASPLKAVKSCKIPILFIHGAKDKSVPLEMLDKLYSAAGCKKEKLVIEGAGHADSAKTEPELYWKAVETFIKVECAV